MQQVFSPALASSLVVASAASFCPPPPVNDAAPVVAHPAKSGEGVGALSWRDVDMPRPCVADGLRGDFLSDVAGWGALDACAWVPRGASRAWVPGAGVAPAVTGVTCRPGAFQ